MIEFMTLQNRREPAIRGFHTLFSPVIKDNITNSMEYIYIHIP